MNVTCVLSTLVGSVSRELAVTIVDKQTMKVEYSDGALENLSPAAVSSSSLQSQGQINWVRD